MYYVLRLICLSQEYYYSNDSRGFDKSTYHISDAKLFPTEKDAYETKRMLNHDWRTGAQIIPTTKREIFLARLKARKAA